MHPTIRDLVERLNSGQLSSAALIESSIAVAERSDSVFITLNAEQARAEAVQVDSARRAGEKLPPYAGIPITLKDLFDVRGEVTTAGSRVLAFEFPVEQDAPVVHNLREAGFIFLGRVNMSEFAFSGMGVNPHYGTPLSVWDRQTRRLPGGSSSGSAVSVAEGIVSGSIGSDTAGSTRIPAAFNGIVGFKPTHGRFPLDGIYPLSPSTDAPGPLANSVECCYRLDAAMAGDANPAPLEGKGSNALRLLLPDADVTSELDSVVSHSFGQAVSRLRSAGCEVVSMAMPVLDELLALFQTTPLATYEAWQAHAERIAAQGDEYDPFVSTRIASGAKISEQQYTTALQKRRELIGQFNAQMQGFDAIVYPTVAMQPPRLVEIASIESARAVNFRCLRNTATANYFDGCSLSLPCTTAGEPPVGLMLSAPANADLSLLNTALSVESILRPFSRATAR